MKIKNWIACVQDRVKWKEFDGKAKLSARKFSAWEKKKSFEKSTFILSVCIN
jgi:hypothetical protein